MNFPNKLLPSLAVLAALTLSCALAAAQQTPPPATAPDRPGQAAEEVVAATPEAEAETAAAFEATRVARDRAEQVRANLAAVRVILDTGLSNTEAGELLREARRRAPDPDDLGRRLAARERQLAEARLDRVRIFERRRLSDDPAEVTRLNAELGRQESYLAALDKALSAERGLAAQARELVTLLDGQLLWIGSAPPVGPAWLADVARGGRWVADPQAWLGALRTLARRLGEVPLASFLVTLLAAALIFTRHKLKARLASLSANVGKYAGDSFLLTARALVVTLLLAAPVPLALGGFGALLASQRADPFAQAVGEGLLAAAAVWLLLDFFRGMCRPRGLAEAHFQWDDHARRVLLGNLRWLLVVEVPAALVTATCDAGGEEVYRQGLGRAAFLAGATALTLFVARVFRPGRGVFAEMMSRDGWAWRTRRLWYAALVGLPAALILAAAAGYYYTATQVIGRFFTTGAVVLAGVVVYSLMTRWLLVARRRLLMRQARQRLADLREARQRRDAGEAGGSGEAAPELETPAMDVAAASGQTLSLLRTAVAVGVLFALWAVWNDLLPALREVKIQPGEAAGVVKSFTLASLLLFLVALVLTVVAARNLPAALELVVLERFPLDAGVRYAATTLTRYLVVAAGLVIASRLLGFDWSRAQWIVAALGVGLGFGLQEIVANFVSGLIILFERPVRVGDTVTVGGISGTVSRLQIRATTITDFDNKEVLVPNKSFITDQVVNWTLSNAMTRLLIPVGVAYGSDVARAHEAIGRAVEGVATVLAEPAPSVLFVRFGDSSLDFEVRAFVAKLSERLATLDALHRAIDAELRAAGIEIPFPQRDLHLRSGDVQLLAPREPVSGNGRNIP